jgi:DNA-binding transcriptional LysR family regulator
VLSTANQVLHQLDTLRQTLNPNAQKAVKKLILGATYNPSSKYMPSAIAAFQKTHPDIQVTFLTSYRTTVEKWVRDGEVDIALIQSPSEACSADLHAELFATDTLVFFAHTNHPMAKKQTIQFEDLGNTPLIVREGRGTTHKILGLLRSRGLKPNIAVRCATPDGVKAAVKRKMGIGLLFRNLIDEDIRRREVKILKIIGLPRLTGNSYIVHNRNRPLHGPATEFLALLREMRSQEKSSPNIRNFTGTDPR